MIGWLRTRVRKQPIIALYFESENELKFYNLEAWRSGVRSAMSAASQLPGRGPLMWMMPLHLHVNQKSDYDIEAKRYSFELSYTISNK